MQTRKAARMVWVRLQIGPEEATFAGQEWSKLGYFSCNDYLNGLLNMALMREMTEKPLRLISWGSEQSNNDMDDDIPF
jgi:hypothetical protein